MISSRNESSECSSRLRDGASLLCTVHLQVAPAVPQDIAQNRSTPGSVELATPNSRMSGNNRIQVPRARSIGQRIS